MSRILVPPIKCQGIKTKLVPLILANAKVPKDGVWIEPFMGSGVVGLNMRSSEAMFSDINPHIIKFYNSLNSSEITPKSVKIHLQKEGKNLQQYGGEYYYIVRERFNNERDPLDLIFLSRSCFNGMMRFNGRGGFNVPFCKKPQRFSQSYVTKIVNQISVFHDLMSLHKWSFVCQDFEETIKSAKEFDFIYCDPPYLGRHVDYFNSWSTEDESRLFQSLLSTKAKFILSTWHSNKYRTNESFVSLWSKFHVITQEHYYHVGASEDNRNAMTEALVMNFVPACKEICSHSTEEPSLFDFFEGTAPY